MLGRITGYGRDYTISVVGGANNETDIAFLREARFVNQGDMGLMQLGAVYKATIELFGNTVWYPGMEVFINPLGIGGTEFGESTQGGTRNADGTYDGQSIANAMGFGGYHLVTRVKSIVAPGKFNTSVEAQFVYAGDGRSSVMFADMKVDEQPDPMSNEEKERRIKMSAECREIVTEIREDTLAIAEGRQEGTKVDTSDASTNSGSSSNESATNAESKAPTENEQSQSN